MADDSKRPLFRRFSDRSVYNPKASEGGKRVNTGLAGNPASDTFTGEFALNNPLGTMWSDLVQTGPLVLSEGSDAEVGGEDYIKITANGNGITIPGEWKNIGFEAHDPANGKVNRFRVVKTLTEVLYSVKVEGSALVADGLAPLSAVVSRVANQSLNTGTLTSISFDTEELDNGAVFSALAPTRLTVATGSGQLLALVTAQVTFASNATGRRRLFLYKNGAPILSGSINIGLSSNATINSSASFLNGTWIVPCVAGDYFEVRCDQDSGGALNVQGSAQISIVKV